MKCWSGLILLGLLAGMQACVSVDEHEQVLKQWQESQQELREKSALLEQAEADRAKLRRHLDRQQGDLGDLNYEMALLKHQDKRQAEDLQKLQATLARTLEEKDLALASASRSQEEGRKLLESYQKQLASLIDAGDLTVSLVNGKLVVAMASDILFPTGSAKVSDRGLNSLAELGRIFVANRERRLQVEGHTDDVPVRGGRYDSNWHLGHARAMAVVDLLLKAGVSPQRLSAASYGEYQPRVANLDENSRQKNRRIEIVIIPDLSPLLAH